MNLLSPTCSAVTAMMSFEFYTLNSLLPDVRTYVVYLSFAGSIGHSLNDNHAVASRKRSRQKKSGIGRFFV